MGQGGQVRGHQGGMSRGDRFGSRLCENSAWYNRTQNFEACGRAWSKKTQKFVLRLALRPNQISFSHSLDPKPTFGRVSSCNHQTYNC